jgi:cobalt-zinc-cadmium efflux system protein
MRHDHHHAHGHDHQHGHDHDAHDVKPDADRRYLTIALALIVGFMIFEIIVGIVAHSLALLSDAGHMLTDAGALILSLVVIRLVQRPIGGQLTYGMRRAEVLSGQANSAVLLVLGVLVIYEAVWRLVRPPDVAGALMTSVAAVGVAVNVAAAWVLAKANRQSLNVEGSFQHIITDLYAFIGTLMAGIVIVTTGFNRADAIASLFVAALMIRSGLRLQRRALRVLLESAPEGLVATEVGYAMAHADHVRQVHDLHLWELAPGRPILTAHVLVAPKVDCHAVRRAIEQMVQERFGIDHTTLQIDHVRDPVLQITHDRGASSAGTAS